MNNNDVAAGFWKSVDTYPAYEHIKHRRYFEVSYVLQKIGFAPLDSLVDVGCGDGGFVKCIDCLLDIKDIYCYDYSMSLMKNIADQRYHKSYFDCNDPQTLNLLPTCDLLMFGGVVNFIFTDQQVINLMNRFDAKHIFIRTPCTRKDSDEVINTYSDKLNADYASIYRTVKNIIRLIEAAGLKILEFRRIYPDDIESSFGTRQWMFYCTKIGTKSNV